MHEPDPALYPYHETSKAGTWVYSTVPLHQDGWKEIAFFHLFWSWSYTARRIYREFVADFKRP